MSQVITKAEKKVINQVKSLGPSCASPTMLAGDLGVKVKTVKIHLKSLEEKGFFLSKCCAFHENTMVYAITEKAEIEEAA